jgi:flagellar basal body-associated protein FliL
VKGGFLLEQKQTIAIVVIIVVIAGAVAGYMIMFPAIPPGGTILMGTTELKSNPGRPVEQMISCLRLPKVG